MKQIFFLGSSFVYGVGGVKGGWADLVKQTLHARMYSSGGEGEQIEVFNLGKSGATIDFVEKSFSTLIDLYGRGHEVISIVSVGGNNSKAVDEPTNYVSTIESFEAEMRKLIAELKSKSTHIIGVDGGYLDESKTSPKFNPFIGGKSYFTNKRRRLFQDKFKDVCHENGIAFVEPEVSEKEWNEKYLYEDGLHPNTAGHELIAGKVMKELEKYL